MEMLQITGVALVGAFLAMIIKEQKPNLAFLLIVFVGSAIFLFLIEKVYAIVQMIQQLAINANVNMVYLSTVLKIIGIAYIAEFTSQITPKIPSNH